MIQTWDAGQRKLLRQFMPKPNAYFVYGLISRLTAKHSTVLACERTGGQVDGTNRVFAAALRSPNGALTWIIVNDAPRAWGARLGMKGSPPRTLYQYRITAAQRDQPGLEIDPLLRVIVPTAGEPFTDTLPPMSLTIYSTFKLAHSHRGIISDATDQVAQ